MSVEEIGATTRREHPDVALVALGESSEHALDLIDKVVHEAACPVIALLDSRDPSFVDEAAQRGVFAYIADGDAEAVQSALDIVLRRFAEYHNLEGAFARRATIERAEGILMAVHGPRRATSLRPAPKPIATQRPQAPRPRRSRDRQPPTAHPTRRRRQRDHALEHSTLTEEASARMQASAS